VKLTHKQLSALAWVARTGSLTAAGDALGRTQPALSAQLKLLSDAVGAPVMARHRHGVTLTAAGQELLVYAETCIRALEGAQQHVIRMRGLETGKIHVLASTSVAVYMLPASLARFHGRFPGVEIFVTRRNAEEAMRALEGGLGDVAVVRGRSAVLTADFAPNFVVETLLEDETVLAVTPDHRLARRKEVAPSELDGLRIVRREPTSATQALVQRAADASGIRFRMVFQTVGVEALKEAVMQGFGAGFISSLAIRRELEAGTLHAIRVHAPEMKQYITIAYPAPGQCAPAVPMFVDAIRETSRAPVAPGNGRNRKRLQTALASPMS
jgi:LysR family transcriptional regulator, low CO2-responsive transcriptional regulator